MPRCPVVLSTYLVRRCRAQDGTDQARHASAQCKALVLRSVQSPTRRVNSSRTLQYPGTKLASAIRGVLGGGGQDEWSFDVGAEMERQRKPPEGRLLDISSGLPGVTPTLEAGLSSNDQIMDAQNTYKLIHKGSLKTEVICTTAKYRTHEWECNASLVAGKITHICVPISPSSGIRVVTDFVSPIMRWPA